MGNSRGENTTFLGCCKNFHHSFSFFFIYFFLLLYSFLYFNITYRYTHFYQHTRRIRRFYQSNIESRLAYIMWSNSFHRSFFFPFFCVGGSKRLLMLKFRCFLYYTLFFFIDVCKRIMYRWIVL